MAVGPIGSLIYANQMMHIQASKEADYNSNAQMQQVLAAAMQNEKEEIVQEVRPAEESYKIDPENEHERQKSDEEQEEQAQHREEHTKESQEDEEVPLHQGLLDVKA